MFLIVDDHAGEATALARLLHMEGYYATAVHNGIAALAALRPVHPPRLLIVDLQMPGMDGFALLRALRVHPQLKSIPVAVYSADPSPCTATRARQLGAVDYLVKGALPIPDLLARLIHLADVSPHEAD